MTSFVQNSDIGLSVVLTILDKSRTTSWNVSLQFYGIRVLTQTFLLCNHRLFVVFVCYQHNEIEREILCIGLITVVEVAYLLYQEVIQRFGFIRNQNTKKKFGKFTELCTGLLKCYEFLVAIQ